MNDFYRIKSEHFTTIANEFLKDKDLSNKAKGVLAMILALPDNWDFSIKGMVSIIKDGEASLRSAINEMKDKRYCVVKPVRINGKIARWKYYFSGEIITDAMEESLLCDFQHVENQQVENQAQYNNINNDNNKEIEKEDNNKSLSSKKKRFVKPTIEEIQAYINEKKYHFSAEAFYHHYESIDWKVGKNKMTKWKSACATWELMRKSNKEENKEETAEELPEGTTREQWTQIVMFLCSNVGRIASRITPNMLAKMKELAGGNSKYVMDILKQINEMAEYDNIDDIMAEFERIIREDKQ